MYTLDAVGLTLEHTCSRQLKKGQISASDNPIIGNLFEADKFEHSIGKRNNSILIDDALFLMNLFRTICLK